MHKNTGSACRLGGMRGLCGVLWLGAAVLWPEHPARAADGASPATCQSVRNAKSRSNFIVFDAKTGSFDIPDSVVYESSTLKVCIDNADYRSHYSVAVRLTDLPKSQSAALADWVSFQAPGVAPGQNPPQCSKSAPPACARLTLLIEQARAAITLHRKKVNDQKSSLESILADLAARIDADKRQQIILQLKSIERDTRVKLREAQLSYLDGLAEREVAAFLKEQCAASTPPTFCAQSADVKELLDQVVKLAESHYETAQALLGYFESVGTPPFFTLTVENDKRAEIIVSHTMLTGIKREKTVELLSTATQELSRASLEVRSLSYVRLSIGVAYTWLADRRYSLGPADTGATVIVSSNPATQIIPMVVLSHNWCGEDPRKYRIVSDLREPVQPGKCNLNLLPTFAIGIPLSRNPFENFFVGLQWQFVPGLAFVGGRHVGRVGALRDGFREGAAPPPVPNFRIEDAIDQTFQWDWFVGAAFTDDLFIKVIQKIIK